MDNRKRKTVFNFETLKSCLQLIQNRNYDTETMIALTVNENIILETNIISWNQMAPLDPLLWNKNSLN